VVEGLTEGESVQVESLELTSEGGKISWLRFEILKIFVELGAWLITLTSSNIVFK
jgi:hypothetical protein